MPAALVQTDKDPTQTSVQPIGACRDRWRPDSRASWPAAMSYGRSQQGSATPPRESSSACACLDRCVEQAAPALRTTETRCPLAAEEGECWPSWPTHLATARRS